MQRPSSLSAAGALQILELFTKGRVTLTGEQFDERFDQVLRVLEAANNEKFRLEYHDDDELPKEV